MHTSRGPENGACDGEDACPRNFTHIDDRELQLAIRAFTAELSNQLVESIQVYGTDILDDRVIDSVKVRVFECRHQPFDVDR